MSNVEKMLAAWLTALREDDPYLDMPDPYWLAEEISESGLLAPELPEPDLDHRDPEHCAEYKTWWEGPVPDVWFEGLPNGLTVQAFPRRPEVQMAEVGEPMEPFSLGEARSLAHALLAAANRAEGES